jgi:hypothetical protein
MELRTKYVRIKIGDREFDNPYSLLEWLIEHQPTEGEGQDSIDVRSALLNRLTDLCILGSIWFIDEDEQVTSPDIHQNVLQVFRNINRKELLSIMETIQNISGALLRNAYDHTEADINKGFKSMIEIAESLIGSSEAAPDEKETVN